MSHHQHKRHHHAAAGDLEKRQGVSIKTVESVVYVTASKTFDGPVAGYSTAIPDSVSNRPTPDNPETSAVPQTLASHTPHSTSTPTPSTTLTSSVILSSTVATSSISSISSVSSISSSSESKASQTQSKVSSSASSSLKDDFSSPTQGQEASAPTASQASPTAESSSSGMSSGGKAGLAIGLILLIGLIAGLIFFFYRRKKSQDGHHKLDDEKSGMQQQQPPPLIPRVSIRRPGRETAPRLSLRPLTDLFPDSNTTEKQGMVTNNGALAAPAAAHIRTPAEKPSTIQESPNEATNPFGDHAELDRDAVPKPLNVSRPSTPTGQASPAIASSPAPGSPALGAAAASGSGAPLNVHRVQLDFTPSMEDELELRAGQLVRMLHEYDDGWALCIRLDRSQQGVVPRSCISKLPVKPRPAGPPGARGPPPPPGVRPVRPGHASVNSNGSGSSDRGGPRMRSQSNQVMGPGPFGSGQYRSGPAPQRPRASTASSNRRDSPPGGMSGSPAPSQGSNMPSRKPVPGQAM
ncbi:MAG: hypothetical protein M1828_003271 [Chrysothrix sp. TS-e1954]|nr:MAG: hypothetical protein M1828_003271 [Chrysothrix sp. TS-e1954]